MTEGTTLDGEDRRGGRPGTPAAKARGSSGGIGRRSSREAEAVSNALRRHDGPFLSRRRRISALSLTSIAGLGVVAAYQSGLLRHLPEPPLRIFDADRVDASGEAYQYLKTPDAALGILSSAATLALAGMGGSDRTQRQPYLPLALLAKTLLDAASGAYLTLEQGTKHRRFCSYCLVAAVAQVLRVPQAVPEAQAAWRALRPR